MVAQDMALAPSFRVGAVVGKSLSVWFQNLLPFGVLAVIFNLPVIPISYVMLRTFLPIQRQILSGQLAPSPIPPDQLPPHFFGLLATSGFLTIICYQLLSAAVAYGVIKRLRGQSVQIGSCFSQAFRRFIPVVITSLLATIFVWLASLLIVIPGIIVALNFWVAIPVCMAEELGARASLSRAKALARGHRWKMLGAILVTFVIAIVIQAILNFITKLAVPSDASLTAAISVTLGFGVINQAIVATLFAVVATCAYYYLRVAKEGVDIDQIAAVFD